MAPINFDVVFEESNQQFNVQFEPNGSSGTTNYNSLSNKPKINNTELSGNKSAADLGLAAAAALAPEYSSSSTYAVGDLVLKDGQLYECNTAISTAEAWNSSHWTSKTVADVTSSLIGDLTQTEQKVDAALPHDTVTGAIVTFSDGADNIPVNDLTVDIEPVQDLHGQANPYPAGGGKNKLPKGASGTWNGLTFTVNSDGTVTVNGTASATTFWGVGFTIPSGTYIHSGCPSGVTGLTCDIRNARGGSGISGIGTDAGNGVTFTINSELTAVYNIRVASGTTLNTVVKPMIRLSSVSDATFAPYENICPISGWSEAKVIQTGVNVWDEQWELGYYANGVKANSNMNIRCKSPIPVCGNTVYYVRYPDEDGARIQALDGGGAFISDLGYKSNETFTTPANCRYIVFYTNAASSITTYNHDISINYPSTDTAYHAYNGQTFTIDLNGTRYGGTLDVTTGVLTVDRAILNDFTGLLANGTSSTGAYRYRLDVTGCAGYTVKPVISNVLKYNASFNGKANEVYNSAGWINIFLNASTAENAIDFLEDNNTVIVYPLATPTTVQLTPQEVTTLLGNNTIFADCGDVTVDYNADATLYINSHGGGSSPSPYTSNPAALGTASPGSSDNYARGDHVHAMPTAANVGAIALPSNPSTNDFLVFNGSAWVAQSLSTWQGGSY